MFDGWYWFAVEKRETGSSLDGALIPFLVRGLLARSFEHMFARVESFWQERQFDQQ